MPRELGQCVLQRQSGARSMFWQNTEFCPVPLNLVHAQCLWITTSVTGMDLVKFHSCWVEISLSCSEQSQVTSHGWHKGQSPLAGKGAEVGKKAFKLPSLPSLPVSRGQQVQFHRHRYEFQMQHSQHKTIPPTQMLCVQQNVGKKKI